MSMIGTRVIRREDAALLTGAARFVGDLRSEAAVHVAFVRSVAAHGRIVGIHRDEAKAMPGVVGVYTGDDLGLPPLGPPAKYIDGATARPYLATDVVRFAGEAVVAVVAETPTQAADAAEAVWIDIDVLPHVLGIEAARDSEDVVLYPEIGSNVIAQRAARDENALEHADVVVRRRIVNHRMHAASIEPRVIAAEWVDGRLTVDASTQGAFNLRAELSRALGLDEAAVRVRHADVGGGFGAKTRATIEEVIVCRIAMLTGRPARWHEPRSSSLASHGHARDQVHELAIGATTDGRIVGIEGIMQQDCGAYPASGATLPRLTVLMGVGPYAIPRAGLAWSAVATNTAPVGSFRGAGRPEATYAVERMVDALAFELDVDPVDLRRRNLLAASDLPVTTPTKAQYDSGDYVAALDRVVEVIGYDDVRRQQQERRAAGSSKLLGIGVASYVEITGGLPAPEGADITLEADGTVVVATGSAPQGQGHMTTWAMLVAGELGVPIERVEVRMGDTDTMPVGPTVGGSRSAQSCGAVVTQAAHEFIDRAAVRAAAQMEAAEADLVFDVDRGAFHVRGTPASALTWTELAAGQPEPLHLRHLSEGHGGSYPFGAHAAVVEVDADTGAIEILDYVAVDDCGVRINPMIVEGQIHGGISGGVGQALFEEIVYDADGNLVTGNFMSYGLGSAAEYPSWRLEPMETPAPANPLGAKGIGESGTIGSMPTVVNAVIDAVRHLGVDDLDTPLTPERIWRAITDARAGT